MFKITNVSEGQRKALFEEAETQQKQNSEEIIKLKKEISQMSAVLQQLKSPLARYRLKNRELEQSIGALGEKTCQDVENLLDLQIIDKQKQTDILKFKTKQVSFFVMFVCCFCHLISTNL